MRFRTGWFPYVLAAIWAAMVIASLVDMASFTGAMRAAKSPAAPTEKVRVPQARTARAM
jgi:hypothetical protein